MAFVQCVVLTLHVSVMNSGVDMVAKKPLVFLLQENKCYKHLFFFILIFTYLCHIPLYILLYYIHTVNPILSTFYHIHILLFTRFFYIYFSLNPNPSFVCMLF